ncbi:Bifunctional DNA primase/polymerase, N-terminal [Amycolatopsis sacchari]|uniref:Bifunctional DNA primase/polymerase, N-terminal n=1 Tax=Amycolatopsis sacchari TaxID=115433 RepID=A0A1I4A7J9_9PSEU|nr:bifunctional DNA primase/polymerase [Amycolatopsis sacchari]SFK52402.1 Bifunctional DNA primase/polymerase, N-terminal [Amycolatopsis sacchari]
MDTANPLLDWALYLAGMGWHVFPVTPGRKKPPMVREWETRATTDPERITRCWRAGRFNIGIATGPSRLIVVDLDTAKDPAAGPDGAAALAELAARRAAAVPATYTVTTPSGGRHLYFAAPAGVHLRNTRGDLAPHIDTRAEGGYVVAPGSLLAEGGYELADDTDPAELPAWLVQACLEHPTRPATTTTGAAPARPDAYAASALRGECDRVRTAPRGQHNAVLSSAAYRLGQLVGDRLLAEATARAELLAAADALLTGRCSCTPGENARVIDAGLAAGARHPRHTHRKEAA